MLQSLVILLLVGGKAVLAENQLGQVKRESVCIFECEHIHTADLGLTGFLSFVHKLVEQTDTFVQGTQECLFLALDHRSDLCLLDLEFRISLSEILDKLRNQLIEERAAHVQERVAVTNGTTENTTDHIAGFLVRRQLTIGDSESDRSDMIRNHAHSHVGLLILAVLTATDSADLLEHRLKDIGVVVRGLALDRTNQTLKAHTGIDHFLCQRLQRTVRLAVILHEDDVPDLDDLRVIFVHQLTSRHFRTLLSRTAVHVDLTTRTARTRIAHFPEVIMLVAVQNMVGRQMFCPDRSCLVIASKSLFRRTLKDRRIEVCGIDLEHIHDIFPREVNRLFLEIVAKRPVAQHLEHRVVIRVVSHFLQVIMLTAHTQTFLTVRHTRVFNRVIA